MNCRLCTRGNGKYFGVNKVGKEYKDEGIFTDNSKLDREDYFHQRVIQQEIQRSMMPHAHCIVFSGAY